MINLLQHGTDGNLNKVIFNFVVPQNIFFLYFILLLSEIIFPIYLQLHFYRNKKHI